jgi:hypothetical protein
MDWILLNCSDSGLGQLWDLVNAVINLCSLNILGLVSFSRRTLLYAVTCLKRKFSYDSVKHSRASSSIEHLNAN